MPTKISFCFQSFFVFLLIEGTFTSVFKEKSQKDIKNNRNQGFTYYFCLLMGGSVQIMTALNPEGPKTLDPDPYLTLLKLISGNVFQSLKEQIYCLVYISGQPAAGRRIPTCQLRTLP